MTSATDDHERHEESERGRTLFRPTYRRAIVPTLLVCLGAFARMRATFDWPTECFPSCSGVV